VSERVLVKGGTVLSMDRGVGNMTGADVLVEEGTITEVGKGLRARSAEVIDASDAIVMPGFVDTHRHAWHALFRNSPLGPSPITAAQVGPHCGPDEIYAATLISLLGAAAAGITTVVDWADIPSGAAYTEAALQAHADSGIRSIFVVTHPAGGDTELEPHRLQTMATGHADLTFACGPREADQGNLEAVTREWTAARAAGMRIHTHAGGHPAAPGTVARLAGSNLLAADVTLIHCTHLDGRDLDAIVSSQAAVCLTPAAEMAGGLGAPPLQSLIDRKIRPGLGIGSEMTSPGDMFAQMRAANSVQHATLFDLKLAGRGGVPNLLTTRDVIRYSTIDGAGAIGLQDTIGSISPGKRGDLILLRSDRPNIAPINDPIGAVVWGMDTSNLDWVLVAGRAVVRDGALTGDVSRARDLATTARDAVTTAAGLLTAASEPA
jgi:5-methylthioadenosine/S-adenosylhomocysteine deaminase